MVPQRWIEDVKVPLVEGKGIPTSTYVTIRQMKILGIPEGALRKLKLSTVQNSEIMRDIYFIMQRNNLLELIEASPYLLNEPGIQYAVTMIKQAGYDISDVKLVANDFTGYMTTYDVRHKKFVEETITESWLS